MTDLNSSSTTSSSKSDRYVPKSVIRTSRKEWFWDLEVRKQEPQDSSNKLVSRDELSLVH